MRSFLRSKPGLFVCAALVATTALVVTRGPAGAAANVSAPAIATGLLDTPGGRETFRYAVGCGLAVGDSVQLRGERYSGEGYLLGTADWMKHGLDRPAREDLFACVAARINPAGNHVPLALRGLRVSPRVAGSDEADYPEALWLAEEHAGAGTSMTIHVWPSAELTRDCGERLRASIVERLAGNASDGFRVVVRSDEAVACTRTEGGAVCEGRPAIETRIRSADFALRHPACAAPAQR